MSEENHNKGESITIRKEDLWKYSTFVLLAILIIGGIVYFTGDKTPTNNVVPSGNAAVPAAGAKVQVSLDDDAVKGDKNAKVTIVEFSDYQCPYCAKFWSDTLPQIQKEYIDTGKVKLVFRDFPLESIHPNALPAAMAAECVKEKGGDVAYYKYHDKLFENAQSLTDANLKSWAKSLGYDITSCLDSKKYQDEVRKDTQAGSSYGVQGTPAFFVNGKLLSGAQPFSAFKAAIDAEL
ncbi:MAG: DsbA family protein [Nanoarchaeota archaeon]|nr:DsbA family protein [Nanoarchaeota archaeon]